MVDIELFLIGVKSLKSVVNCVLREENKILMLQKPKRGWWVVPGGKVEEGETLLEAILREFKEETNLTLERAALKGVFNIIILEDNQIIDDWMLFTYFADDYSGRITENCIEGILQWKDIDEALALPKAMGDNIYLKHLVNSDELITGKFYYTSDYTLLSYALDPQLVTVKI